MLRPLPQVMMGINDGQVRLEDRLGRLLGQPRLVRRVASAKRGRLSGLAHADAPLSPAKRGVCNGVMPVVDSDRQAL